MRLKAFTAILTLFIMSGCGNAEKGNQHAQDQHDTVVANASHSKQQVDNKPTDCKPQETLIYGDETFSSYTEDEMRGKGVISFQLDINDRLDIFYLDGTKYCFVVYNEDNTFYTIDLPRKVVARALVPEADVAQFDFDAEDVNTDKEYLYIYINKQKCKVKKADAKFTFNNWGSYLKMQNVHLRACNKLSAAGDNAELTYKVMAIRGDEMNVKSVRGCSGEDSNFEQIEGWVKWKNGRFFQIDLALCD